MSDQQTLISEETAAAVLAAQMRIIDAAVRQARRSGWCDEFERIMDQLFPDGPPDGSKDYVDSDGWSCRGRDRDGRDADGYDRDGYDRDGYDRRGYDQDGYSRGGYDQNGWNREGLNLEGQDRNSPEVRARYRFNYHGYDRDGYRPNGLDPWGHDREWNAAHGVDPYRFDENGVSIDGQRNRNY